MAELSENFSSDFKNSLQVDLKPMGFNYLLHFLAWEQGLKLYRESADKFKTILNGTCEFNFDCLKQCEGYSKWERSIPSELKLRVKTYPLEQIYMLRLVAQCEHAKQLLMLRPFLLYLICKSFPYNEAKALAVCKFSQRDILKYLGLNHSKSALKFIAKLKFESDNDIKLGIICQLLRSGDYLLFRFYKSINKTDINTHIKYPKLTGSRLALSSHDDRLHMHIIVDTIRIGHNLCITEPLDVIKNCANMTAAQRLHDRWTDTLNFRRVAHCQTHDIPYKIVFSGTDEIYPITHFKQLAKEGSQMRHCVMSYHDDILNKGYQVFSATIAEERLTIGIGKKQSDGTYYIEQVKGKRNKTASKEALTIIFDWFKTQSLLNNKL